MEYTLKQLRYALAVAETGHFGQAAEQCHVTQSALSQQIKQLEQSCNAQLFERRSRSVRVTSFGKEFLVHAEQIIRDTDALTRFATENSSQPNRALKFGLIPTVAPYLLPEIYPALRADLPNIRFDVREGHTDRLLAQLDSGELDLALIATEPPAAARLEVAPLFADPFVVALRTDTTIFSPVKLGNLPHDQILLLDEGHCFRDQAMEACAMRGANANMFAATSLSTIVEFVANGQGLTLLPAISLKKEAANPHIAIHPLAAPGAERILSLVWQKSSPFGALFRQVHEIVSETGQHHLSQALVS